METTTELDGAPSPWQLHPVSTTKVSPFFQGGPPGIAKAGAIKRSAINPRTKNRVLRVSIVAPILSTCPCPLNVPFIQAPEAPKSSEYSSAQISFIAEFNWDIIAFPSPKSIIVLSS
jgi:hypothetical protein